MRRNAIYVLDYKKKKEEIKRNKDTYKELLHKAIDDIESESRLRYLFGIANRELVKDKTQNKKGGKTWKQQKLCES